MSLNIRGVRDKGILGKERVVLYVEADIDIGRYILVDTRYLSDKEVSSNVRHSLWLPDYKVEAGDLVVVYTKSGNPKQKRNEDQSTTHFFYWGMDMPIWAQGEDCAVLIKVDSWIMKRV